MEDTMKIYRMENNRQRRAERRSLPIRCAGLKRAAGAEDMVSLTREAIELFSSNNVAKIREQELKHLALRHINDRNPELENLESDPEFVRAEKLALLAELVIRVAPSVPGNKIYDRVSDFVVDQLCCSK